MSHLFYASFALLWILVLFQSLVLLGLLRTVARIAGGGGDTAASPPLQTGTMIGQPVPSFTGADVFGRPVDETSLPRTLTAVLFVTPDCVTCMASLDELEALQAKTDGSLLVVCRSSPDECRKLHEQYGLDGITMIVDQDKKISEAFDVYATPTAVLVGANGRIRTYGHPMDKDELNRLIATGEGRPRFVEEMA